MSLPSSLSHRERALLALAALLSVAAVFGPAVPTPALGGAPFADGRSWGALPNAMDVLSNLPFAVVGIWGLRWLHWLGRAHDELLEAAPLPQALAPLPFDALDCAWMFFAGLILTALGSAFYHLQPDPMRLADETSEGWVIRMGAAVCWLRPSGRRPANCAAGSAAPSPAAHAAREAPPGRPSGA